MGKAEFASIELEKVSTRFNALSSTCNKYRQELEQTQESKNQLTEDAATLRTQIAKLENELLTRMKDYKTLEGKLTISNAKLSAGQ